MMENADVLYSGLLVKSPPMERNRFFKQRWRERYFCLYQVKNTKEYHLDYFRDEKSLNKKKGSVDLDNCNNLISNVEFERWHNVFSLKTMHKQRERQYYFCASSPFEMDKWVELLCKACCMIPTEEKVKSNEMLLQQPQIDRRPSRPDMFTPAAPPNYMHPSGNPNRTTLRGTSHLYPTEIGGRTGIAPRGIINSHIIPSPAIRSTNFGGPQLAGPQLPSQRVLTTRVGPVVEAPHEYYNQNESPYYNDNKAVNKDDVYLNPKEDDYILEAAGDRNPGATGGAIGTNPPVRPLPDPRKPLVVPPPRRTVPVPSSQDLNKNHEDEYYIQPSEGKDFNTNVDMRQDASSNHHDSLNVSKAKMYRRSTVGSEIKEDNNVLRNTGFTTAREALTSESSASSEDAYQEDAAYNSFVTVVPNDDMESLGLLDPPGHQPG